MSHPFLYRRAASRDDAADLLAQPGAMALGGGTDLLPAVADQIARPDLLVDLRAVPDSDAVTLLADGTLRLGASCTIAQIAAHAVVRERHPALADACGMVGTPALRNMGTLGGNLCQRPRCWYFRRAIPCLKNGGPSCPAVHGENQYLAILDGGPCHVVHPSDPAVALTALDARVEIGMAGGGREVPIADFFVLPSARLDSETVLEPGAFVTAVLVPPEAAGGAQRYHKLMQREAWDFALVSLAACRRADGDVRLVLGGVAPRPWRVSSSVEEDVAAGAAGAGLDDDTIATLAERALYDAAPLSGNGYKVELAAALLRQAIRELV
ncbi:MAG TPA: xanthine dehydrogenase family protein subunit M [Gemmatimonadaceae bacterium]|nr:xanthine dehydrogenase family protein subunit M [Gemmatimonadaceae bacterium]